MTERCAICDAKGRHHVPSDPTLGWHIPLCRPHAAQAEWRTLTEPPPPVDLAMARALLGLQR
jgi:hypothetical protein